MVLAPDLRARYFDAIVKFEQIAVPLADIERVRTERMAEAEASNEPPQRLDDVSIELDLRLASFEREHGRGLSTVIDEIAAMIGNHSANYLMARANSSFFDDVNQRARGLLEPAFLP